MDAAYKLTSFATTHLSSGKVVDTGDEPPYGNLLYSRRFRCLQ